jgi:hypothetical protein
VSALIKGVIDVIREMPGYAGMAVYFAHECVYADAIDRNIADGMYDLFNNYSHTKSITAIVRGYSLLAFGVGDTAVVARFEGRYFHIPRLSLDEDDIVASEPAPRLISRDEARREAQQLLRSFNILPHD